MGRYHEPIALKRDRFAAIALKRDRFAVIALEAISTKLP